MGHRKTRQTPNSRQAVIQDIGRIMATEGISDVNHAQKKALERLGLHARDIQPSLRQTELEQAMVDYQRLFMPGQDEHLRSLRETALEAMRFLQDFDPRLVGPVLTGAVSGRRIITLHLFTDRPEDVYIWLIGQDIPAVDREKSLRVRGGGNRAGKGHQHMAFPSYQFVAGEDELELVVLPLRFRQHPPLNEEDHHPMRQASISQLEKRLENPILDSVC